MSTDPPGYGKGGRLALPDVTQSWLAADGTSAVRGALGAGVAAYEAQAMSVAMAQGPALLQVIFFLWMTGNQLTLWTMFFFVSMGTAPIRNLMNVGQVFKPLAVPGASLVRAQLLYVLINLGGCLFLAYKVRSMGLAPITSADWVSLLPLRRPSEVSAVAQWL